MNSPPTPPYRDEPLGLEASWTIEEADYHEQARATPGATLALVRYPIAFFIAFASLGIADRSVGIFFALGSSAVIAFGWLIINIATRGSQYRAAAKLPVDNRTLRIWIDNERWVLESQDGRAQQFPRVDVSYGKMAAKGALICVAGVTYFIPRRAMLGAERSWESFVASLRPWRRGLKFTIGLWLVAVAFAISRFK